MDCFCTAKEGYSGVKERDGLGVGGRHGDSWFVFSLCGTLPDNENSARSWVLTVSPAKVILISVALYLQSLFLL